jgi:hypothetical protein
VELVKQAELAELVEQVLVELVVLGKQVALVEQVKLAELVVLEKQVLQVELAELVV